MTPNVSARSLALLVFALLPAPVLAAGGGLPPLVRDIGFSLLMAGLLAVLFSRLRIPPIAGFLVAGVLVGPAGAHMITDSHSIDTIAQLGLILLLFVIGLELDFRKILSSGKTLLIAGALQFPLCVLFGFVVAKVLVWLGIGGALLLPEEAGGNAYAALYLGFVVAASSTLLVVKLFQETFQLDTAAGRISLGLLIIQDIWAIIVIAVQPNFDDPRIGPILFSFVGIGMLAALTVAIARYALPVVFRWIAKSPELVLVAAISWCFGIVFLGAGLGGLGHLIDEEVSLTVGSGMSALIAGASIASLPYSIDVVSKVGVLKDFFVTLFFVALGMSIPVPDGFTVLLMALLFAVVAIAARYLVFFPLLYWTGVDRRNALVSSTRLAQISEFTLVVAYAGVGLGHISDEFNATVIFAFVLTALATPTLFRQADRIHDRLGPVLGRLGFADPAASREEQPEHFCLAILGFHRIASSLLHEIERTHPHLLRETLVVDYNVHLHEAITARGPTVRYGDLAHPGTLHHSGVDKADVVIVTIPDDLLKGTTNRKLVEIVRHMNPGARLIANAVRLQDAAALYEAGADYVFLSRVDSAQALMPAIDSALHNVLHQYRVTRESTDGRWHERVEVLD